MKLFKNHKRLILLISFLLLIIGGFLIASSGGFGKASSILTYRFQTRRRQPNVILITLDTLRRDHLSCYGYLRNRTPNLDRFFEEGISFTNAVTTVPLTLPSHASILSGFYPTSHGVRDNGLYVYRRTGLTISELLKDEGYATAAFISSFVLDRRFGLSKGFDLYDDDFSHSVLKQTKKGWELPKNIHPDDYEFYERRADEVTGAALNWLGRNKDKKFFLWVHYYDPHRPYYGYSSDGLRIVSAAPAAEVIRNENGSFDDRWVRQSIQAYDGEISYLDFWVGKLLDTISMYGLDNNTLILVLADHGESMGEHNFYFGHGECLFDELIKVPLMLHLPYNGPKGVVIDEMVRTIDIAPTIYDVLGIKPESQPEGVSLIPLVFGIKKDAPAEAYSENFRPIQYQQGRLQSIRNEKYKIIFAPLVKGYLFFDLEKDPMETENILFVDKKEGRPISDELAVFNDLRTKLQKVIDSDTNSQAPEQVDKESQRKLKSLGYM